jgi:hypothetical protein
MTQLATIAGFIILGLSPSFIDFRQSPELRGQFIIYYLVGIILIAWGMDGWVRRN